MFFLALIIVSAQTVYGAAEPMIQAFIAFAILFQA
jgi:hypothetical protein